ncbi:hypothetical protein [Nocardia acidivorans]|uniref:hypothetical protein n=1 Tax=Nocardia acidivorans TaxID=404580 RepID=UPI00082BE0F0|nr:hypothetical protein [Nocardia acidivorans]
MGFFIIKAAPQVDLYAEWSTSSDQWTFVGTRAELLEYLHEQPDSGNAEDRVQRADDRGSSYRTINPNADNDQMPGTWSSTGLTVQGIDGFGWLPRPRLADYLRALYNDDPDADRFLEELDDSDAE